MSNISVTIRHIDLGTYRCQYPGEHQHRPAGLIIDFDRAEVRADYNAGNGIPECEFNHRAIFMGFDSRLKLSIVRKLARHAGAVLKGILERNEFRLRDGLRGVLTANASEEVEELTLDILTAGQDCENWDRRLSA